MPARGSTRRRSGLTVAAGALAVAVVVALVVAATAGQRGSTRPAAGTPEVGPPPAASDFSRPLLTWAQDSTLHHGRRTFDLSPWLVRRLAPSAYGMFAEVVRTRSPNAVTRWVRFDGRRARALSRHRPDDVRSVVVSPDGRYVGWVDYHGPRRTWGHAAKIVVRDLATDRTVLETSAGMGGNDDQDLYGDSWPQFLGFDDGHAYWVDAEHQDRWRWDLRTHHTERAQKGGHDGPLVGHPVDPREGREAGLDAHGRLVADPTLQAVVHLSPGGAHYRDDAGTMHVSTTGRRVRLTNAGRHLAFAAWRGDTGFYALSAPRRAPYVGENGPHPIPGRLVSCSWATSRCATLRRVVGIATVVVPAAGAEDW